MMRADLEQRAASEAAYRKKMTDEKEAERNVLKANIRKRKTGRLIGAICFLLFLVLFVATSLQAFDNGKTFDVDVHSYIVNARYDLEPQQIIDNVTMAENGMHELGLTNGMSSHLFSWEQTPQNNMQNQYAQLDQIIAQCQYLIGHPNDTSYGTRMSVIQNQLYDSNGWADDVASGAYALNITPWTTYQAWGIIMLLGVFGFFLMFINHIKLDNLEFDLKYI